jgi:hypothetical protein
LKKSAAKQPTKLTKSLYEAGLQCLKRLWLDVHDPQDEPTSLTRAHLAEVGAKLTKLACSAFPKGIEVAGSTTAARAAHTKELLAGGEPVVCGATFVGASSECVIDIVVQHKDGKLDLFEVKSGTKVKLRYLTDMALQLATVESAGHQVRASYLLHVQPRYAHKEGTDFPPMQLLRSTDVTARVRKVLDAMRPRMALMQKTLAEKSAPELPMGSHCTTPFRCPHYAACAAEAPDDGLHELPDLDRKLDNELRKYGAASLRDLDPNDDTLSFKQRRTVAAVHAGETLVEPFIRDELRDCRYPLHFVAIASVTEPLPQFEGQRPWRHVPFGWAVHTLTENGRTTSANYFFAEKGDPRRECITGLAKVVEAGGTLVCWNDRALTDLRELLEDLPDAKEQVRAVLARGHLDLMHLFDAGIFHPKLRGHRELATTVRALVPEFRAGDAAALDEEQLRATIEKMNTPRSRKQTRDKLAADLQASLDWCSESLLAMYRKFAGVEAPAAPAAPKPALKAPVKKLPKPI